MLESFVMNRPINNNEIEMFLRSLSCAEICQEISTANAGNAVEARGDVLQASRIHENPPTFCGVDTSSNAQFIVRQNQPNVGELNKGRF